MDIKDLKYEQGIIINSYEDFKKTIDYLNEIKYNNGDIRYDFYYDGIILYPYEGETSELKYAKEKEYTLFNLSEVLNNEPNYEIY